MWVVNGNDLKMAEGDWGIELPISVSGVTLTATDSLKITLKSSINGATILEKNYVPADNTINFSLTQAESELFPVGNYVYALDWYKSGQFMCNLIPIATFRVVDKA